MPVVRRTRTMSKPQRILLQALLLCLIITIAFYFFIQSSFFNISTVVIKNNLFLSSGDIRQLADVPLGSNTFKIDDIRIKHNLMLHPMIKDVKIYRELPDVLTIYIVERTPVILIPSETGFLELDETGVFLKKVSTISNVQLPILTGVKVDTNITPGQVVVDEKLAKSMEFLSKVPVEYQAMLMEIELKDNQYIIYTPEGIKAIIGNEENISQKLQILQEIINGGQLKGKLIDYIDLTTVATPVVKYRN